MAKSDIELLAEAIRALSKKVDNLQGRGGAGIFGQGLVVEDTEPPQAPTNLQVTLSSPFSAQISWNPSSDNVGVVGYNVIRDGAVLVQVAGTNYADSSLQPSTTYVYAVQAVDGFGNLSELSDPQVVTTPLPGDVTPPSTPQGLTATAINSQQIDLDWNASSDNIGVTGYTVYRNGVPIASPTTTLYSDMNVTPGAILTYTVDAFDAAGNHSGQSTAATVTVPQPPVATSHWVSPTGTASAAGTEIDPWSLAYALNGAGAAGKILAGHTVYILDGTYQIAAQQVVAGLAGASGNPIVFRAASNARPTIRNTGGSFGSLFDTLKLRNVSYTDFFFLEFTMYQYNRSSEVPAGGLMYHVNEDNAYTQSNVRFYGCVFHDSAGHAVGSWQTSDNIEYNGCVFYFNGSSMSLDHTLEIHGNANKNKKVKDCIVLHSSAGAIQSWANSGQQIEDLVYEGNIFAALGSLFANPDRGIFLSGASTETARDGTIKNNFYYQPATPAPDADTQPLKLGSTSSSTPGTYGPAGIAANSDDGRWASDGSFSSSASLTQTGAAGAVDWNSFFRFINVTVPVGATITSAFLKFTTGNAGTGGDAIDGVLRADKSAASPAAPTTAADADGRAKTSASAAWDFANWTTGTEYTSPDLVSVIQEIVNQGGWASGNALVLYYLENGASTNDMWIAALENATLAEASLTINYTTGGGGSPQSFGPHPIQTGADDGRWTAAGAFNNSANLLVLGDDGVDVFSCFTRFSGVTIPPGATITDARVNFYMANAVSGQPAFCNIRGDKSSANPTAPGDAATAAGRTRTTSEVAWNPLWEGGTTRNTPNLAAIVQEIVNQGSWASGNAMVFYFDENASLSTNDIWLTALEDATNMEPQLSITYTTGGSGPPVENVVVQNNFFVGGSIDVDNPGYTNVDISSNTIYFSGAHEGNSQSRWPTNQWIATYPTTGEHKFVRTYDWDNRRANVVIFNWGQATSINLTAADLANVNIASGDQYVLRNAQDYYTDWISGTYNGISIPVLMSGRTLAAPGGGVGNPASLFPRFGVFQLIVSGGGGPPPPPPADTQAPSVPTSVDAVADAYNQVTVTWTASTDNVAVTGYRIFRNGLAIGTSATTSFIDGTVMGGITYTYTVSAYDAAGNESAQSAADFVTTPAPPPPPSGDAFYVSPSGTSSNNGSITSPWSLTYALAGAGGLIGPGDTIYLRGGNYSTGTGQIQIAIDGNSTNPIVFRAYPGEVPVIRNTRTTSSYMLFNGSNYLSFYDIVWTGYNFSRPTDVANGTMEMAHIETTSTSSNIKFFGCHFKNSATHGARAYLQAGGFEMNGCFVIFNGQSSPYDHGIYTRNNDNEQKTFRDCIIAHNASHGVHCWGSSSSNQDEMDFLGCVAFQNGSLYDFDGATPTRQMLIGGTTTSGVRCDDVIMQNCDLYTNLGSDSNGQAMKLGYGGGVDNFIMDGNVIVGSHVDMEGPITASTFTNNKVYSAGAANTGSTNSLLDGGSGNVRSTTLPSTGSIIRVRAYNWDNKRANITVFNWANASTITVTNAQLIAAGVNISAGKTYELHNAENYFGDVISGTYNGSSLTLPMTGRTVETPYGGPPAPPTAFPKFGCFVLRVTS